LKEDLVETASNWLGEIVERANLPQLTDLGGALIVYNNLTCSGASVHTFRRFPIAYVIVGRERRYRVDDIIAFARKRLEETPIRRPAPRPRCRHKPRYKSSQLESAQ
jgi:hypothetical protein